MTVENDTVQKTLYMPLWARAIAAHKAPQMMPDHDAERILRELGAEKPTAFYRLQYVWSNVALRHWNMAQEVLAYLEGHPRATVVELGAGLSCQRRQMAAAKMPGTQNPWYAVDFPNVIELRERLIPDDDVECRVAADLNDFAWMDKIDFDPGRGIVFIASGLFYYFRRAEVRALLCELARRFPGGAIAFDAANARGAHGVNKEIELSGIEVAVDQRHFSLEDARAEIGAWSPQLVNVVEKSFFDGYGGAAMLRRSPLTLLAQTIIDHWHLGFFVHVDFAAA